MKQNRTAMMIAALVMGFGAMAPVSAQQAAVKIGYVDMEKVFNDSTARQAGEERVNELARVLQTRLGQLRDSALLPSNTWQEYRTILEKEKPTDADRTRMAAIQNQVKALDEELKNLQQTTSMTDAQKARYNELNGNTTANAGNLQQVVGAYGEQIGKLQIQLRNDIVENIKKAAQTAGNKQGVAIVLNKSVSVGEDTPQLLVVAGGVDLSQDVLNEINKAK